MGTEKKAMAMTCAECPCCCPGHEYSCCYMVSLPVAMTLSITVTTSDEINEPSGVCTRQLMATTQEVKVRVPLGAHAGHVAAAAKNVWNAQLESDMKIYHDQVDAMPCNCHPLRVFAWSEYGALSYEGTDVAAEAPLGNSLDGYTMKATQYGEQHRYCCMEPEDLSKFTDKTAQVPYAPIKTPPPMDAPGVVAGRSKEDAPTGSTGGGGFCTQCGEAQKDGSKSCSTCGVAANN